MHFTDQQLCQLIDGELSALEESEIRAAIATDKQLAERFAQLAMIDVRYKSSVSSIDEVPVPETITGLLFQDQLEHTVSSQADTVRTSNSFWKSLGDVMVKSVSPLPSPTMAFTLLLFMVLGVTFWQSQYRTEVSVPNDPMLATNYGILETSNPVAEILSNAPSGSSQVVASKTKLSVTPILSFASSTGAFCREYVLEESESSHRAVACYQDQGWRVVLSTRSDASLDAQEYQTASSLTSSNFEERIKQIISGDPLSYQQELLLIERGWSATSNP